MIAKNRPGRATGPAKRPPPKPAPASPKVPLPESIARDDDLYQPELAEWTSVHFNRLKGSDFTFQVFDELPGRKPGMSVATIVVNPALGKASAAQVANLMAWSPGLWRMLRAAAPYAEDQDVDGQRLFHAAVEILRVAAERYPYEFAEPDKHEDAVLLRRSNALRQSLGYAPAAEVEYPDEAAQCEPGAAPATQRPIENADKAGRHHAK